MKIIRVHPIFTTLPERLSSSPKPFSQTGRREGGLNPFSRSGLLCVHEWGLSQHPPANELQASESNPLKWVEALLQGFLVRFNGLHLLARNSFAGGLTTEALSLYTQLCLQ